VTIDFERVKQAIARVTARDAIPGGSEKTGTAFYIGGGYALTALHVIADTQAQPPEFLQSITLRFAGNSSPIAAKVSDGLWSVAGDWAVIECEIPPDAAPIELGALPQQGSAWLAFGYPEINADGMVMAGEVRDPLLRPLAATGELPMQPVLQLFGKEASAGMGARLHGFSGAPCLIDGKAVGILRSTLIEEIIDGRQQRLLFTQAGTIYATPAQSIVDWQADRRMAILPGSWAPPAVVAQDFVVLLSQREPNDAPKAGKPQQVPLRAVALQAYRNLKDRGLREPYFLNAAEVVSSEERLRQCVRALCNAKVVVFDATDFEPAIMFLAGIRAVVKRGVTLLSVGGDYALGKELSIPFNITDANIVAHSREQNRSMIANSVTLLTQRIAGGLDAIRSPQYLDLPVYDAIRRLPAERRGIIPSTEGVLVLCPFDKSYAAFWEENLKQALAGELEKLRKDRGVTQPASFGVSRSFELNSPRLVTHAIYEAIRRLQWCVIDLSDWSANVLFELGVRLAASGQRTVCIIDGAWDQKVRAEWLPQCRSIEALFVTDALKYDAAQTWEGQAAFSNAYGPDALPPASALLDGGLHALVERALDVDGEPASRPAFLELQDQAAMFSRDPGAGGRSKPVGLFPGNAELVQREETAEFERLLAAWLYISNRYAPGEILESAMIRDAVYAVIQALFERHAGRLSDSLEGALSKMWDQIDEWSRQHVRPQAG